jgi:hypothetical protein
MHRMTMEVDRKMRKGQELAMRLEQFGGRVVRISEALPSSRTARKALKRYPLNLRSLVSDVRCRFL